MENLSSENKVKIPIQIRVEAYNFMNRLKEQGIFKKEIIEILTQKYEISDGIIYSWYAGRNTPWPLKERNEVIEYRKELFYLLGALLGDGCIYHWKGSYQIKIYGEEEFIQKCAIKLSLCLKKKINKYFYKSYFNRHGTNLWYIQTSHKKLFDLFKNIRTNLDELSNLMKKRGYRKNSLQFIEGFFDAEGCIKIIKEVVRKTPKICPDICCTTYEYLKLCKDLFKEHLGIEARYSIQKAYLTKDGHPRKTQYHLRIYKKEYIRKFFENVSTIKLKPEKVVYVNKWLNNGK